MYEKDHVAQCMRKTIHHLADVMFVQMTSFMLTSLDALLDHLKPGVRKIISQGLSILGCSGNKTRVGFILKEGYTLPF